MKAYWKSLSAKVDVLSRRERVLVMLGALALVWIVLNAVMLAPVFRQEKTLKAQLENDLAQNLTIKQQLQIFETTPIVDPDAANRTRLNELRAQQQLANASLDAMQRKLVSPDKMAGLLEDILKKNEQLKLVSLKTLPPTEAGVQSPGQDKTKASTQASSIEKVPAKLLIYRHGVELKVQGRYLDLLKYLHTLEKLPWHMLWGNVSLTADAYPQSTLTVTIYTLSLDQAWLSL